MRILERVTYGKFKVILVEIDLDHFVVRIHRQGKINNFRFETYSAALAAMYKSVLDQTKAVCEFKEGKKWKRV